MVFLVVITWSLCVDFSDKPLRIRCPIQLPDSSKLRDRRIRMELGRIDCQLIGSSVSFLAPSILARRSVLDNVGLGRCRVLSLSDQKVDGLIQVEQPIRQVEAAFVG